ncbi:MAG TPA: amino acid adenylation domain-containing protein [Candidatus Binatia bacterium]|jgi:amino acid adenylation domain-containing protein/FkbM family methyltransferase
MENQFIPRIVNRDSVPLSFAQQRLWFLDQLEPDNPLYNVPTALRLSGKLSVELLRRSLDAIVARHEALRTTFVPLDGIPVQVIGAYRPVELTVIDLAQGSPSEREAKLRLALKEESRRPFKLSADLMLRATLARLDDDDHVLLLVMHHIASDGWSREILFHELAVLYRAFAEGKPEPLPERPIQYADFAVWQRERLQGKILEDQLSYWKQRLAGLTVLDLPIDHPRPAVQSFRGARQSFALPKALCDELKAFSRRQGLTLFMTLLSAFQVLLHRYTGQDDIVIGSPIAGRTRAEIEELIGLFINTLVLRGDLSGDPKFTELLARVRQAALEAYEHQELPFEKLVEELRPERDPSRSPLFQVMFVLQNMPRTALELAGVTVTPLEVDSGTAKFDLTLSMAEQAGLLRATLEYSADLFEEATIERMAGHFQTLLEGIVRNPDQRLSELRILTEAERHRILIEWNDTKRDYPTDKCIHELFEEQVERTPDAVAVVFPSTGSGQSEDRQLTYGELNRRANQLAHYLKKRGVGPEALVGLCVERSLEMVVGLLGILKAGGAYLPLDTSSPNKRLAFILQDAHIAVLLTQRRLAEGLSDEVRHTICLDTDWQAVARESDANPVSSTKGENLAYVIYTSGSTGTPKGVLVEHRQILNYVKGISDRLHLEPGAGFAMVQPLSVDSSQTVIFPALISGGCLHVISEDRAADPRALGDYFRRFPIDLLKIAPSHLAALHISSPPERLLPRRWLVLGGEASRRDWVENLRPLTRCSTFNHYGPTEATVGALTFAIGREQSDHASSTVPIGRPLPNIHVYILDPHGQPLPVGIPGELHIGGSGVTRGYLNRPELTTEKFIPNPFSDEPGARLYKSGDVARYLPDGNIEFLGRADHQVKIRGFRVELGEIEAVLGQHPDVRDVTVLAREDIPGRQRLVAYIVANKERAPTTGGRQRYRLPNHMAVAQLNKYETDYIYEEIFERQAYLKHGIAIREGDCVFDVGANIGLFTIFVRQMCKTARVYAFEPNPFAFEILSLNASLYAPGAKLFDCGLSNETKTASFTFFPGFSLFSGFYADAQIEKEVVKTFMLNQQKAGKAHMAELLEQADGILDERFSPTTLPVRSRTLSAVMEEEGVECIDLLKINAEKSELDVLNGINDVDWKKIKQIVLEVDVQENLRAILSLLERQGYDFIVKQDALLENTQLRYVYAIRPSEGRRLERNAERAEIEPIPMLSDSSLSPDEVRRFLRERLPEHMVPSALVFLQALPLTPHGKVDRRALPAPEQTRPELESSYITPRTEVENVLAAVWMKVLKLGQVGIHDNFFDLGGHSLLATQVISRLREAFHVETPMRALFESPTVAGLAKYIESVRQEATGARALRILPERVIRDYPLSFSQERFWFLSQLEPNNLAYKVTFGFHLTGPLNTKALEQSLTEIVRRHETLRTTFHLRNGEPVQVISERWSFPLTIIDLRQQTPVDSEAEVQRLFENERRRFFDLSVDLLLRATLLQLGADEHVLVLSSHHVAWDHWCIELFLCELSVLYQAFATAKPSPLSELPIQYKHCTLWQRKMFQGAELENYLAYWKKQLSGAPASLNLPADHPRKPLHNRRGGRQTLVVPKVLDSALRSLSRKASVTFFMTLLAAFQTLLHRMTGEDDIVVGTPVAGRDRSETEGLIGLFLNSLALRTNLSGNPTFLELLARVREVALGAYDHQELPFEKLVAELQPERYLSRTPIFQVFINMYNFKEVSLELDRLSVRPLKTPEPTPQFDLELYIREHDDGIHLIFVYDSDLFESATIARLLAHFQVLLEGIISHPGQRLSDLPLLTEAEKYQLLVEWNDTHRDFPRDKFLHELIEVQAEKTPDAAAVVFEDKELTYRQLNQRANQLARYLRKHGVGPDVLVGICVERSLEMLVGLLGILKAGGAYVPLDPAYPKERLDFMLKDAQAPVVLTQKRLASEVSKDGIRVVCLDSDWRTIAAEGAENLRREGREEDRAYVLYTSGSTGKPKGVQIPQGALRNFIHGMREQPGLTEQDVLLAITTFCFDIATLELFLPLVVGARLVIAGREAVADGRQLIELIAKSRATVMQATPATWRLLLDAGWPAGARLKIIAGGEPLTRELASQLLARSSSLWNGYGPTETTVYSSLYRVDTLERPISIGRPVPNTRLYILDSHFQPVPIGVPGELLIGGIGVAHGYLNRPELTAEKFIRDPFSEDPESRLYRTGDLVRYLPDGNIDYLGRIDNQVKLRGFRIEPGEIETVLAQHPIVRQAVITAREDVPGDKRLVAYVVANEEKEGAAAELRNFLKAKLPDYMVPSAFVFMESLPLTPNGKIDRRALPAPDRTRLDEDYVAPRTLLEELIAEIWAEVLKLEKVGIHNDFFDLGGHSLLATQVVSRMRESLQVEFPLRALFEEPTVSGLAEQVEEARRKARGAQALPILAVSREEGLPLSFAQQRLWFLDQLEPKSSAYNIPGSMRLRGSLNVAALERSLNEIVRRHAALRTTFSTIDGEPVQKIAPSLPLTLAVVDLTDRAENTRADEAQRIVSEEARRPFDLSRGPLLRIKLIQLGEQDHVLILIVHHIVSDGWSMGVLYRELSALYRAFTDDRPSPLSDLPIQYADFAVWQREWLAGEVLESQLSYWKNQLAGAPAVLNLPADRPRPALQSFRGARESVELTKELIQGLHAVSRQNNVTLFMTLLAAFQTLLQRYTGQDDIVVGSPIGNRNRTEIESLIGMFVNTLVLRSALSGEPTFTQLLARVREVCLGAYAHQDIPFEKLVEELHPERSLGHSPLFQVLFNMINVDRQGPTFAKLAAEPIGHHDAESKFDLTLYVYVRPDDRGIGLTLVFNTDLFDAVRMQELLDQFTHLLEQIAAAPDQSIGFYSLVTERSRQLLPDPTAVLAAPNFLSVTREFLAWAEKSPEQKAVTQDERFLTYGELSGIAGRIARSLAAHGITPGDVVAVAGPRCFGMIASIVGALMSGGVLLTIDRNLPANRQRLMIEAGRVKCLLYVGDRRQEDGWLRKMPGLPIIPISKNGRAPVSTGELAALDGVSLPEISPDDPAYIFFTSGTTAVPKGVLGCHKGLSHFLAWQKSEFQIGPEDRCGQLTNFSFDVVLRDIFLPLVSGATLVLPPETLDPASELALSWLDRQSVTLFHGVPTLVQHWLGNIEDGVCLRHLRWAFLAGEPLLDTFVRKWRHTLPRAGQIVNLYGPTETTLAKCFHVIPDEPFAGVQPVGKPLPQTQALVLNRNGRLCGVGEPGEIVIRTPFRTRGYINSPEEQAKRFAQNPFRADPDDVIYYTGDGGRYGTDGALEILGRLDKQIKIRGVRIEPDEVTAILSQHTEVKACFVAARKAPDREPVLVAYVVPFTRNKVASSDLRSYLAMHLPAAAVPAAVVFLEALPLSPNGKVNAQDLPERESGRLESTTTFLAPRNATEQSLAKIWCEVLKLKKIGVLDNFFDLGGHSLMATQLVSRIRRNFGLEIPLQAIFEQPTIAGLALYLLEQQAQSLHNDQFHELLAELDDLSDAEAERQLLDLNRRPPTAPAEKQARVSTVSSFHCPQVKSEFFGKRRCNLIILINERFDRASFEQVAAFVRELDPTIDAVVVKDTDSEEIALPQRPTLTFSPALIRHRPRRPGRVFCGYPLSKSQEYEALAKANIAVPRWALLSADDQADLSGFDDYLVRKPNYGGRSAEVLLVRRDRIKWKPITTKSAGTSDSMIVQQFVYTGALPACYRVNTLFGQVLYAMKYQANGARPELPALADLKSAVAQKGFTVSATAHGSFTELCFDEEVIRLGERAHAAFPEIPLLGFDIVREMPSGKLYVLEANAIGYTWSIAGPTSAAFGLNAAEQFDGLRKAAYILAEKTQQCAE